MRRVKPGSDRAHPPRIGAVRCVYRQRVFRSWEIDFQARAMRLEFLSGAVIEEAMTRAIPMGFSVHRSRMDLERRVMLLTLDDGQTLEVDIGVAGQAVPADVSIVYR